MSPLPVTIVSGYLGAGKTTLLNRLLTEPHGRRLTVLVNDFGEIAIDAALIDNADGDTIALANGCMCCSIGDDLFRALDRVLQAHPRPDHLLIETSGVADPGRVARIARAEPELLLHGCAVLVDALNFGRCLADPLLTDTLRRQLAAADLVLVTKTDIVAPGDVGAVAAEIGGIAPHAPWIRTDARLPLLDLLGEFRGGAGEDMRLHHHGREYAGWVWRGPEEADEEGLRALLAEAGGPYRLKGFVKVGGRTMEIQRAGGHFSIRPAQAPQTGGVVALGPAGRFDPVLFERRWRAALRQGAVSSSGSGIG